MEYRELFSSYGIETDQIIIKDNNCVVTINMNPEEKASFCEMVNRLNVQTDNAIRIDNESDNKATIYFEQRWLDMLTEAVSKGEHKFYITMNQPYYDIKLGYSCNNNCIHCIIKPNIIRLQETNPDDIVLDSDYGMWCRSDLTYEQVLEQFNSESFRNTKVVTLTGGEPTIRTDFVDILKWLYFNRPDIRINLQTNGRAFSDLELVKSVRRYCRDIRFLIAVHSSNESIHNKIVNNRKEKGNPFIETMEGLKNIQAVFPDAIKMRIEIETVLSLMNYMTLFETIKDMHEQYNIVNFKFSYPDMQDYDLSKAKEIAPEYQVLGNVLVEVNRYCKEHKNINVLFEDIPPCVLHHYLGTDIQITDIASFMTPKNMLTINAVGSVNEQGYFPSERRIKLDHCKDCSRFNTCQGLWPETVTLNEVFISSINKDLL